MVQSGDINYHHYIYCIFLSVFSDASSSAYVIYHRLRGWLWTLNWGRCGRQRPLILDLD